MTFFLKVPPRGKRKKGVLLGWAGGRLQQEGQKSAGKVRGCVWEYFRVKRTDAFHLEMSTFQMKTVAPGQQDITQQMSESPDVHSKDEKMQFSVKNTVKSIGCSS